MPGLALGNYSLSLLLGRSHIMSVVECMTPVFVQPCSMVVRPGVQPTQNYCASGVVIEPCCVGSVVSKLVTTSHLVNCLQDWVLVDVTVELPDALGGIDM